MGLEGVELVMDLEECFGVAISDAEAERCVTPAEVTDLILGKLRASDEQAGVSQRAFYLLRKGLMRTLGVERRSVALGADVRELAADESHREVWDDLRTAVHARSWPALGRPPWLIAFLWLLSGCAFFGLIGHVHWILAVACALFFAFVSAWGTRQFRSRIPARYSRIRDLVPFAVTSDVIAWAREQVASLVRKSVIEQLALRDGLYREDAHFVKDLGMGR